MKALLVVGVGRSGTSLLQSMFAAHPEVAYMPETSFIRRYIATGILEKKLTTTGDKRDIKVHLNNDRLFSRLNLDTTKLVRRAIDSGLFLDLAVYKQVIDSKLAKGTSWIGDKDPRLIEFLPMLPSLFENLTVINIIRDPRDVLLSKKKSAWSNKSHVWKHIFANRVQLKLGRFWGPRILDTNYHEVIYEKLISSPYEELSRLCIQMSLPFDKAMLSFEEAAKKLVSESERSWKKETFGPLLSRNKNKWKTELPQREIVLTELCCREAFTVGRYSTSDQKKKLTWFDKLWVLSGLIVIFLADWPYRTFRHVKVKQACKRIR